MGATSGIQESPPDATTKLAGGLSRVQERAKRANPKPVMPPTNGTTTASRAGFKRRSTQGFNVRHACRTLGVSESG
jgi:hypothetical protein